MTFFSSPARKVPIDFCSCYTELVTFSICLLSVRIEAVIMISIICILSLGSLLIKRNGRSEQMMKRLKFLEILSAQIVSSRLILFVRARIGPDTGKTTD